MICPIANRHYGRNIQVCRDDFVRHESQVDKDFCSQSGALGLLTACSNTPLWPLSTYPNHTVFDILCAVISRLFTYDTLFSLLVLNRHNVISTVPKMFLYHFKTLLKFAAMGLGLNLAKQVITALQFYQCQGDVLAVRQ